MSIGTLKGGVDLLDRRISVAEQPENPRHQGQVGDAGILAGRARGQSLILTARLEYFEGPFDGFAGTGEMSHEKSNHGLPTHRIEQRRSITARFGETEAGRRSFPGPPAVHHE